MGNGFIFKRVEKKYLLTEDTYNAFMERITPYIEKDTYGEYTICNLYYDTNDFQLIRHSLDKPIYKEKLRLRSYGIPKGESKVYLELKKKYDGVVYKRRVDLTLDEAKDYLEKGLHPECENQIFHEIDYFIQFYKPDKKVYIAYDREAYSSIEDPELRITFDKNIRSRFEALDLSSGDHGEHLLGDNECLMEIKTGKSFPIWLVQAMSELNIFPSSFSKYGKIYQGSIS